MKKFIYVLISLMLLMSGCGTLEISFDVTPASAAGADRTATPAPIDQTPDEPASVILSFDSTSDEIQAAMLESATKWDTIWLDGTVTWHDPAGSGNLSQVFHEQVHGDFNGEMREERRQARFCGKYLGFFDYVSNIVPYGVFDMRIVIGTQFFTVCKPPPCKGFLS